MAVPCRLIIAEIIKKPSIYLNDFSNSIKTRHEIEKKPLHREAVLNNRGLELQK